MKTKLFYLVGLVILFIGCSPINSPDSESNSNDTTVIGDTIWENSSLIGKWCPYNYNRTYIFEDGVIYTQYKDNEPEMTHLYINYGNVLHLERLYLGETNPARCADCKYRINGDTLFIEQFSMTISSIYPPEFRDATLIKVKE
jgi:hypothetical protein